MKVYQIDCSNCGASLDIEEGKTRGFCQYCGTPFVVNIENQNPPAADNKPKTPEDEYQALIKAERARNYPEAIRIYDEMLSTSQDRFDLLIGRAFAMIAESKENLFDLDKFKNAFTYALTKTKGVDPMVVHIVVLDKLWSIKHFLLENTLKIGSNSPDYIHNLVAINDLQMYINSFAATETFANPHKTYVTNYKNLKEDIKFISERILLQAKRFKGDFPSKQYLKYVENNLAEAEKELSVLNRKYY